MSLIEWNDSLSVKVSEFDNQHKKLISMINELDNYMRQGRGNDVILKIINDLDNYTKTHFKTEEKYFDKFGYPDTDNHKKTHAEFVRKVSEFKNGLESRKLGLSVEVMNFLSNWLKNHIKITDMRYSQFFSSLGLN